MQSINYRDFIFNSISEAQQNVFFTLLQQLKQHDGYTLELDYKTVFELAQAPEKSWQSLLP